MTAHGRRPFKPLILAVCNEPNDLGIIEHELRKRYDGDYRVVCERSALNGLRKLRDFRVAGEEVAVVLAEQRMPEMSGVEFLSRVREIYPVAKRLLLVDLTDTSAGAVIPRAMALGRIDYFEAKPGPPPNERFHQVIADFLEEWTRPYRSEVHAVVRVVGERWSARTHESRELFERYGVPHAFYPAHSAEGRELLRNACRADR